MIIAPPTLLLMSCLSHSNIDTTLSDKKTKSIVLDSQLYYYNTKQRHTNKKYIQSSLTHRLTLKSHTKRTEAHKKFARIDEIIRTTRKINNLQQTAKTTTRKKSY